MTRHRELTWTLLVAALTCAPTCVFGAQTRAFVSTTDFFSGALSTTSFGPPRQTSPGVVPTSSDAVLRWYGGLVYVINRLNADNIQVVDPSNGYTVVRQFSVGNGSNPHDIEFASATKAYITRYEVDDLLIVDPSTGAVLDSISLAPFADADGIPEMDRLALRGGRLFVTVQQLDRNNFFLPAGGSQVVVIDVTTDTIVDADPGTPGVQGLLLPAQQPFTEWSLSPSGELVVGCLGEFGALDGRIVAVDPLTLAVTTEITEAALGGDIQDVAMFDATRGYAVIADASFSTVLKSYRRDLGTAQTVLATGGFDLADIEVNDRAELWVSDRRTASPGLRIFDAATGTQLTTSPIGTGLPPFDIGFDSAPSLVAVGPRAPETAAGLRIVGVHPNPTRGAVTFSVASDAGLEVDVTTVEIVDVQGRAWWSATLPAGPRSHRITWDGSAGGGQPAPAGLYFVRARSRGALASARLIRVR